MSKRQFVTLRARHSNQEIDVELPGDQPIYSLMPDLLKVLNWPVTNGSTPLHYYLQTEEGDALRNNESLVEAGVENFDAVWILLDESQVKSSNDSPQENGHNLLNEPHSLVEVEERGGVLPPPIWTRIPIDAPCLVSMRGIVFVLGEPPVSIGRRSRDNQPDIDLSELDTGFIASRRHAEILFNQGKFTLRALNAKNGMLINGMELKTGDQFPLRNGDTLQFGFRGVQLIFRIPMK